MDDFTALGKSFMCSDSEIEAFFAATSTENTENDVSLKKELTLIDDHGPENDVPKPIKGLYEEGPPPFLKKTYAMVDDSQTDSVISWSESGMSFVIWDHHKFSADILPKHFKHCNFSSFIRQLNTYGFKKLSSDRWEYAVEGFQKGKYDLLKNIKRRRHQSDHHVLRNEKSPQLSFRHCERLKQEAELEKLERDTNMLRVEILNIQKEQESADNYLLSVKERLRRTEHKQQQIFIYMAKEFKNPLFNEILMQQLRQKVAVDTAGISKKQKLIVPQCSKDPVEATYNTRRSQAKDKFAMIDAEMQKTFFPNEKRSPIFKDQKGKKVLATKPSAVTSDNCVLLENLLADNVVSETTGTRSHTVQGPKINEVFATKPSAVALDNRLMLENLLADDVVSETKIAKEKANIQHKIVRELEELITKTSASWDVSMKEMVEQAVCLQSQF